MKVTKVDFKITYSLASFGINLPIGFEIELADGEHEHDALSMALKSANEWFEKTFPELVALQPRYAAPSIQSGKIKSEIPDLTPTYNSQQPPKTLTEQIQSCTDLKILESYRLIVKGKPEEKIYSEQLQKFLK